MSNTLLVDGDNLLTIGFYGQKNRLYKGQDIGGLFHFIYTLKRSFENHQLDKICVFWDGREGSQSRKKIYHLYKENRKHRNRTEEEINSYQRQRNRVKQYLEELYVRQAEFEFCEADDGIAFYSQTSPGEKKIIYSSDRDLVQLISDDVELYNPSHRKLYRKNDMIEYDHEQILIENVKLVKILCGDPSDNIHGIRNLGIKRLLNFFPEIKTKQLSLQEVRDQGDLIFKSDKDNKLIQNFLSGVTKTGVYGEEFFDMNNRMVCLDEPILTDEAKEGVLSLINDSLDSDGRSYKNTMKMMMEDGLFNLLPKSEDAWINFLNPFLRLTRLEKNKKKIIKFNIKK
jgi:5'-3' exonuclease